tara:strand:+ start:292 stop:843 length:552 start_codon:yes stop_codon:yes gene_type:complete
VSRRKKITDKQVKYKGPPSLNIMPFIDIFSILNTFLLMSATFVNIGIIQVQIPFLSSAPAKEEKDKPTRTMSLKVNVDKAKAILTSSWSSAPIDQKVEPFTIDESGMEALHKRLVKYRTEVPKTDKVTVFSDDDVTFENLTAVLDSIKSLRPGDPKIYTKDKDGLEKSSVYLYEKVVLGSIML